MFFFLTWFELYMRRPDTKAQGILAVHHSGSWISTWVNPSGGETISIARERTPCLNPVVQPTMYLTVDVSTVTLPLISPQLLVTQKGVHSPRFLLKPCSGGRHPHTPNDKKPFGNTGSRSYLQGNRLVAQWLEHRCANLAAQVPILAFSKRLSLCTKI